MKDKNKDWNKEFNELKKFAEVQNEGVIKQEENKQSKAEKDWQKMRKRLLNGEKITL